MTWVKDCQITLLKRKGQRLRIRLLPSLTLPSQHVCHSVFIFCVPYVAHSVLVSLPGIKPVPHIQEVWSFNHWVAREVHILPY